MKLLPLAALASVSLWAASTTAWEMNSYQDFVKGRFNGVSLSRDGRLMLAPRLDTVFTSDQPVVWNVVRSSDGSTYVATGHRGRIYRIDANGNARIYWTAEQPEVFALAIDAKGVLYAGTSPDGRIYRIEGGKATEYFAPQTKYVWSLAFDSTGALYAGTDEGKIFRVTAAGQGELFYETGQSHVTSLALDAQRRVLAGTEPNGILYRIESKDKAFVLYDANLPEIRSIVPAPDGSIYAAALGGSMAGRGAATGTPVSIAPTSITVTASSSSVTVTDSNAQAGMELKPKADAAKAAAATPQVTSAITPIVDMTGVEKSAIYRIRPDNTVETIWSSKDENAYDLLSVGDYMVFTTDQQGRIYRLSQDRKVTLLVQTNEGEVTRLIRDNGSVLAATSNLGKLFRLGDGWGANGSYESPVHDSNTVARWGNILYRADDCGGCTIAFRTRTGNSARPDKTWSDWSAPLNANTGGGITSPNARYIQWKMEIAGAAAKSPVIDSVTLSYLPQNTAPVVRTITVTPIQSPTATKDKPVTAAASSTYSITVSDSPDVAATAAGTPTQLLGRVAMTQVQVTWQVDDAENDRLIHTLYFRGEGETEWKLLKANIAENTFALDGDVLADGRYTFRVVSSDKLSNPPASAREGELISTPVLIDNTPPVVKLTARRNGASSVDVEVNATDTGSALRRCEYAVDAAGWTPIDSTDGVYDSLTERATARIEGVGPGERLVVVRCYDSNGNAGLAKAVVR